jgi:hypothetical protein
MQRHLFAVVVASVGAWLPLPAHAQAESTKPAPAKPGAKPTEPAKPDAKLSEEAQLSRVVGLYEAAKYRECGGELERLLDPTGRAPLRQAAIVENARVYWAACLLGAGDAEGAEAPLRAAIHENPQMKAPDSLVFPQPVVDLFLKVRDSLVSEIRAAEQTRIKQAQAEARKRQEVLARERDRLRLLEVLARQETQVVRNSRMLAMVPFGVGQFQNRQPNLGYSLLISEALLGSLCYTSIVIQSKLTTRAYETRAQGQEVNEERQRANMETWGFVKRVSFWSFAALAVGGVVQAQLEFVPEFRETRTRPLPKAAPPTRAPKPVDVSAVPYLDPGGAGLSVQGRF